MSDAILGRVTPDSATRIAVGIRGADRQVVLAAERWNAARKALKDRIAEPGAGYKTVRAEIVAASNALARAVEERSGE